MTSYRFRTPDNRHSPPSPPHMARVVFVVCANTHGSFMCLVKQQTVGSSGKPKINHVFCKYANTHHLALNMLIHEICQIIKNMFIHGYTTMNSNKRFWKGLRGM